jgi:anti-anti-sigma regulatory factor
VVFSFFKKDGKDSGRRGAGSSSSGRPGARPVSKPVAKQAPKPISKPLLDPAERANARAFPPAKFATTENAIPAARDLARSLAMETAAKIDAIESEMARDFLRPAANTGSPVMGPTTGGPKPGKAAAPAEPPAAAPKADVLDPGSDAFLGNINAIDVNTSGAGSIIDETAILFANGQADDAEATMRHGIDTDTVGENRQTAWKMLFELVNQRGDAAGFEQLTMQYTLRFENSSPTWIDYAGAVPMAAPAAFPAAVGDGPVVRLPAAVDAQIIKELEHLKALAGQHAALTLDVSAARSIDLVGAELLLRVVNAFKRSNHELTIVGVEHLLAPLRAAVESGRRDASDATWMLLLEVLRLLGRQSDFEETGIQYCITYEVSPPSWEPAPPSLKTRAATAPAASAPAEPAVEAFDPLDWRGVIEREGEPFFGRLAMEARNNKFLTVECRLLRRMGFSTATTLLTLLMKLQAAGVRVDFANVNPLVAALFHLLGITAIAGVQVRRA